MTYAFPLPACITHTFEWEDGPRSTCYRCGSEQPDTEKDPGTSPNNPGAFKTELLEEGTIMTKHTAKTETLVEAPGPWSEHDPVELNGHIYDRTVEEISRPALNRGPDTGNEYEVRFSVAPGLNRPQMRFLVSSDGQDGDVVLYFSPSRAREFAGWIEDQATAFDAELAHEALSAADSRNSALTVEQVAKYADDNSVEVAAAFQALSRIRAEKVTDWAENVAQMPDEAS